MVLGSTHKKCWTYCKVISDVDGDFAQMLQELPQSQCPSDYSNFAERRQVGNLK